MDPSLPVLITLAACFTCFVFGWFFGTVSSARSNKGSTGSGGSSGGIRPSDMRRLECKVDMLLKHFDLTGPVDSTVLPISQQHDLPPEVLALLPGKKIEAIKLMRERTGLGLKEAKDKIDEACRGMGRYN
jgi:hypothetical protein